MSGRLRHSDLLKPTSHLLASDERRSRQWQDRRERAFQRDYGHPWQTTPDVWKCPEPERNQPEPENAPPQIWVAPTVIIAVIVIIIVI